MSINLCTQEDLELRVSEEKVRRWALLKGSADPDTDVVQEAIEWADGQIYAALTNLYANHIVFTVRSEIPIVLVNIAVSFAVYWLASRFEQLSDAQLFDYKDAKEQLKLIMKGEMALMTPDGENLLEPENQAPFVSTSVAASTTSGRSLIFTRSTLENEMLR